MSEPFIGIEDFEVTLPTFELADVAEGLAAIELLFRHYQISQAHQEEYFNATLVMLAGLLVNNRTLVGRNLNELSTVRVNATIPIPAEVFLENRMTAQQTILERYKVNPTHQRTMKNAVLFYVSCELWNNGVFPKPGLPDVIC